MPDIISLLTQFVDGLPVSQNDKSFLKTKINDSTLADEDKKTIVSDFVLKKIDELDSQRAEILKPILDDAEAELAEAEKEYEESMKSLDEQAQKLLAEAQ